LGPVTFLSNIASNTFGAATGWNALLTQLNVALESHLGLTLFRGTISVVSLVLMVIWAQGFIRTKWTAPQFYFLQYMCLLTMVLWVFLYATTALMANEYNLASVSRYYFPIGFGWVVLGAVALDKMPWNSLVRSLRFYSLAVPLLFTFFFYTAVGVFGHRYATMPNSGVYWQFEDYDQDHAAFLSRLMKERGKGPDLVITQQYNVMLEVGVPIYWRYKYGRVFYSSENLEVWAMIEPDDEKTFL
jgi:hypothetical protein